MFRGFKVILHPGIFPVLRLSEAINLWKCYVLKDFTPILITSLVTLWFIIHLKNKYNSTALQIIFTLSTVQPHFSQNVMRFSCTVHCLVSMMLSDIFYTLHHSLIILQPTLLYCRDFIIFPGRNWLIKINFCWNGQSALISKVAFFFYNIKC